MNLQPFPDYSRLVWRRIDVPGREDARIERTSVGWHLSGELNVEEADQSVQLHYAVECDREWRTRSALVQGMAGDRPIHVALDADGMGHWTRGGRPQPEFEETLDIDLGFTPATNTLAIRRLGLRVGEQAPVRSAWLRFPELRLEPLEQVYVREADGVFRYVAQVDGAPFTARLDVDAFGRVLKYEGLWEAERMDQEEQG